MVAHVLSGAGDADGGNGASRDIADGCRDATDLILVLLQVEGITGLHVAAHARQPLLLRDLHPPPPALPAAFAPLRAEELEPCVLVEIQDQGLAEAGGGHRLQLADPRADVDAALARDFVEIKYSAAVENAEVHGVLGEQGEALEMWRGDARQVELVAHPKAELEELWPQAVAAVGHEAEIAPVGERGGKAVCGAARQAEACGQIAEFDRAFGDDIDHVEAAKESLAAEARAGAQGPFCGRLRVRHAPRGSDASLLRSGGDSRASHYVVPVLVCGTCLPAATASANP